MTDNQDRFVLRLISVLVIITFSSILYSQVYAEQTIGQVVIINPDPEYCGKTLDEWKNQGANIIEGTENKDNLKGTNGIDVILGFGGDDKINGKDGNDCLVGGDGKDRILGGKGDDKIFGGSGKDKLYGSAGKDEIHGGMDNDKISGNHGDDLLFGGSGDDSIKGGKGDDKIFGEFGNDDIKGGKGNDDIFGNEGDDKLKGEDGNDKLFGNEHDDSLDGGKGTDSCDGGTGTNQFKNCEGKQETILITGVIRDFSDSHPNMEQGCNGGKCAKVETGIVGPIGASLGQDNKPVFHKSTNTTSNSKDFDQWYNDIPDVNLRKNITLELDNTITSDPTVFTFKSGSGFFPIDKELLGNEGRKHNYHFTIELHSEFKYNSDQMFKFSGDDDLWVFIDRKLALDLGGVHPATQKTIELDNLELRVGETYPIDIFFAERQTVQSNFRIDTSIPMR